MDLFVATQRADAIRGRDARLPGEINTADDEFDATFLDDGATVVFTRAPDLRKDDVRLFQARRTRTGYDRGDAAARRVNTPDGDAYAPMLDWSRKSRLTFTTRRPVDSTERSRRLSHRVRMEMIETSLLWFCALGCGLIGGLYFAFSAFIMRALGGIDAPPASPR